MPDVLRRYIPGNPELIPYTMELPKDTTSAKAKGKALGPKAHLPPPGEDTTDRVSNLKI